MRITILELTTSIIAAVLGTTPAPTPQQGTPRNSVHPVLSMQASDSSVDGKLGTRIRNGTVVFMNPMHMIIACRQNGRTYHLDLDLSAGTVQKGGIVVGSPVTVHYRTSNGRNLATSIQLRRSQAPIESGPAPQ